MAQLAGMTLRERWSDWKREPFTADSTKHVSVWEKTGAELYPAYFMDDDPPICPACGVTMVPAVLSRRGSSGR